ncbi:MAG: cytochrome b N-terminal domain-containing protein, partial [Chloroflexota bacterium]
MFQREERRRSRAGERLPVGIKNLLTALGDLQTAEGRARVARQTRESAWHAADDTVRAFSAGLGIADVRALLRGDPPVEKATVREQALSRAFWTHFRPRAYQKSATKFSHTLGLGFFSVFFAVVQLITGTLMMIFYEPSPERAYQSTIKLIAEVPFGQLIRDLHYISANLLVLVVFLHLLRVYLTGAFKPPRRLTWVIGVLLLVIVIANAFTGTLLPMDQSAFWGINIAINPTNVLRVYLLHTGLLPGLGLILVGAHYYRVSRLHGISLPASEEESPDESVREQARTRVNFLPDIWTRELMWSAIALFALLALAAFAIHAPLGSPADPTRAPAVAPWFLLWRQGMLKDSIVLPILLWLRDTLWIDLAQFYNSAAWQGVILLTLFVLLLLSVPYLDTWWDKFWGRTPSRLGRNRKMGIALGLLALLWLVTFTFIGTPNVFSALSPASAISREFLPDDCALAPLPLLPADCGEVRQIGYAGLPVGTYDLAKYAAPSVERFPNLLSKIQIRIQQADAAGLADARAVLIVEDWQTNLKMITLRITWTPRDANDPGLS